MPLEEGALVAVPTPDVFLALDEALTRFAVENRTWQKLSNSIISPDFRSTRRPSDSVSATANRHWAYAKAWLRCELAPLNDQLRLFVHREPIRDDGRVRIERDRRARFSHNLKRFFGPPCQTTIFIMDGLEQQLIQEAATQTFKFQTS